MLKPVSNRNFLLTCSADCPADNHARQLAQFLYETLAVMQKNEKMKKSVFRKSNVLLIIISLLFIGNIYSQTKYTGYYYSVNLDDYTSFKYTREYKENGEVYETIYKIYHPTKGFHTYTVIAKHLKSEKKVTVRSENAGGGNFSLLNEEETTYDYPSMEFF